MDISALSFALLITIGCALGEMAPKDSMGAAPSMKENVYMPPVEKRQVVPVKVVPVYAPVNQPAPGKCERAGQFLRLPSDRCRYQMCLRQMSTGSDVPKYVPRTLHCPPGSCVPQAFTSGYSLPCTEWDNTCVAKMPTVNEADYRALPAAAAAAYQPAQTREQQVYAARHMTTFKQQLQEHKQQLLRHKQQEEVQRLRTSVQEPVTFPSVADGSEGQCQSMGQLLRDPRNKCNYLVCTAGVMSADGYMSFVPVSLACPQGTSVPMSFKDQKRGDSPCSVQNDKAC